MLNWLITIEKNADLAKIKTDIESIGGEIDLNYPANITVGDDHVMAVKGPTNFSKLVKMNVKGVTAVFPNSDIMLS